MYFLKHKFQIVKEANIVIIKNCITNNALVSFEDVGIDLDRFQQIIYYGQSSDKNESIETLEMNKLISSFPDDFISTSDNRIKSLIRLIRQYTEFLLPTMISSESFEQYINIIDKIIKEERICEVYLSLDTSLPYISKLLSEIPFLSVTKKGDEIKKKAYDIVIIEGINYEQNRLLVEKSEHILFLNLNQINIEIGPLVFASKFKVPNIEFDSFNASAQILKHEELLIYFFLEKILYITFFELYDKVNQIDFYPARSQICIDRLNLQGYGKLIPMYPNDLED